MRYESILSKLSHQSHMGLIILKTLHPIQEVPYCMISLHCHFSKESSVKPDPSPLSSFYSSLFFAFFLAPFLSSCHSGVWLKLVSILG